MAIKSDIKCPKCNHKNRIKVVSELTSEDISKVINREIFLHECKNCHEKLNIEYPIKITGDNYIVHYTPTSNTPVESEYKEYMRICDTFDDLKEKLLIFNDNLNDIVIEFMKSYIRENLDEEKQKNMTSIRYEGKDEDDLYFRIIGLDQSAKINRQVYKKLLSKIKIKKIKKCVLVDEYTYKSYYKWRLL